MHPGDRGIVFSFGPGIEEPEYLEIAAGDEIELSGFSADGSVFRVISGGLEHLFSRTAAENIYIK